MFTGIITEIGEVRHIDPSGDWTLTITAPRTVCDLPIGASVACNGVCLTVIRLLQDAFVVQASCETLKTTALKQWQVGTKVNLERALRMGDELGGHMVSGHVDGEARLISAEPEKESLRLVFEIPQAFAKFIAPKGSVTLDGVSLTVNEVDGTRFGVNIVPHTQQATTLGGIQVGHLLNFEVDLIARHVERLLSAQGRV
ncbi:MAG: riboflavin synthase [Alphaproteobacteria bacterium]|nr:riboflavin synthase [Alphaproteobacteria bacterium]